MANVTFCLLIVSGIQGPLQACTFDISFGKPIKNWNKG